MLTKLDLKKHYKHLYAPSAKEVSLVDVPPLTYVMIDGTIEPGKSPNDSPGFEQAMGALYGMAYTLKFASKQHPDYPVDYKVMGLEGLWWVEDGEFDIALPDNWHYTLMILQPDHITRELFDAALVKLDEKKPNPANRRLRLAMFHEGLSLQIMHVGPYAQEMETIARMDAYAQTHGFEMTGKHHEIYLGDPRRADPEKLKTILRHPVKRVQEMESLRVT